MPFRGFGLGKALFHDLDKEYDLLDRDFRLFAEECDQMQGVQIMATADNAWGGFATEYVAALRDEYSKVAIVTWGLESGDKVPRVSFRIHRQFYPPPLWPFASVSFYPSYPYPITRASGGNLYWNKLLVLQD